MSRSGWMLGGGLAMLLAGMALLAGPAIVAGQAGASMTITPPSQNVDPGDDITIEIKANNVSNLGAYDFVLEFNPAVLEFTAASDYGFLASTGRSQTCFGFGQAAASVNQYRALRAGCGTNGLIDNGQGKPGPSGSGTLAQVFFKAKASGTSNLVFKGLGTDKYYVGAPDPSQPEGAVEAGQTSLTYVEVCANGVCEEQDLPFAPATGIVAVIAPGAASPTALPPTPTVEAPSNVDEEEFQATVAAAVGTPRVLATVPAGQTNTSDTTGGAGTAGGGGQSGTAGSGGVRGSTGSGELPEGVTIGPDGIPRGPDGAPIAGYGLEDEGPGPVWLWGGLALLFWGAIVMGCGACMRLGGRSAT